MTIVQYKCPNCSAPLQWGAEKQIFCCEYCDSEFTKEQLKLAFPDIENMSLEQTEEEKKQTDEFSDGTSLFICESCGAEIIADENTAATFCYYCHNPTILKGRLSGEYKPSHVIPFAVTREKAVKLFKDWCSKRWFLPKDFKSEQQLEKMAGVYIPFWLADCKTDAKIEAVGRRIRTWQSGDMQYTNTREYLVKRSAVVDYVKVPADGSSKAEDALMEAIEPFDYKKLEPFSMSYLSGYLAEKYDIKNTDVLPRIRDRVVRDSESLLMQSINYSSVSLRNKDIKLIKTDWHYTLLPVWFMTYKHGGKSYYFSINGQTGKLAGTPPFDTKKGVLVSLGAGFAVALIISLILVLGGIM